jgi:hypothetical protein
MVRLRKYCGSGTLASEFYWNWTMSWAKRRSNSDMSEIEKSFERSQPEAGPSRLTMSSVSVSCSDIREDQADGLAIEPYEPTRFSSSQ